MPNYRRIFIVTHVSFLVGSFALAACGDDGGGSGGECSGNILPGDLVITEVMPNPAGTDTGQEWFEIYNASSAAIDLSGLTLEYHKVDGSEENSHVMEELVIEPGDYVVVGGMAADLKPDYVDYGFGNDLGSFLNGGAVLALRCGDEVIDETTYPDAESEDGVAFGIDGNVAPNSVANDTVDNFCPATVEFASLSFGSPGESNEPCNLVVPGMCNQAGTSRATVPPAAGDIVISEFLADSDGSDTGKEWFEIYVAREVDLNGLVAGIEAGKPKVSIDSPDCVTAPAQTYFLFAASDDMLLNGGMDNVDQTFNFTMKNGTTTTGDGYLFVGIGETVLDEITYTDSTAAQSTALDPGLLDVVANDDPANFFACERPYGDETNKGTPRESNAGCSFSGMCRDGDVFRAVTTPAEGDIRITETLANPALTGTDATQEWFEVEALADFDLNGLEFGDHEDNMTVSFTVDDVDCVSVSSGAFLLFAHGMGDLPRAPDVIIPSTTFALDNSNGNLFVMSRGIVLHALPYETADDGVARALNQAGTQICNAEDNYAGGNFGSPGEANPASTTQCDPL
jgi:hypothetical protein